MLRFGTQRNFLSHDQPHVVHQNDPPPSQQGSLHSMRQQLSTQSSASALHAMAASEGSGSSRPSTHSAALGSLGSGNSRASIMQMSVGSGRRLRDAGGPSPAVSAFGPVRPVNEHGYWSPYPSPPRSPVALRPVVEALGSPGPGPSTARSRGRGSASAREPESPVTDIPSTPWATGLDSDWTPR